MKCDIKYTEKTDDALAFCLDKLTLDIKNRILEFIESNPYKAINEIRLHKNSNIILIADFKNIKTDIYINENDINEIFEKLCNNSLYAHISTIKQGYISIGKGIRAGVCGKANFENGEICGIYDISSINIRIPKHIYNASEYLFKVLKENHFNISVLLYSSPGVGKTTILKDLIYKLINETDKRFSVIDTREEMTPFINCQKNGDFFVGYPKGLGIELATKSMTPEIIICDEISSKNEAYDVLLSANAGVKLIATTHANSINELLLKSSFKDIFDNRVFDYAIGVKRNEGESKYQFTLDKL
ncbi:MAG: hypothetical protein II984_02415 [Clostridia bacterium]|nr:hypothetical protein [Clostridia bacterium]